MRVRRWGGLLLTILCLLGLTPSAHADGDPASDVLLSQDTYLPYAPPVQARLKKALEKIVEDAEAAGYPIKVALIMTEADLGAYPDLFNQPQRYTDLLSNNLGALNPHGNKLSDFHLLVVMPGGFGGVNLGDKVNEALGPISIQGGAQSDGLAKAAIGAVARLATINGHPVKTPPEASLKLQAGKQSTRRKTTSPLIFAAPALLLFIGLAVAGRIAARRQRDRPEDDAEAQG